MTTELFWILLPSWRSVGASCWMHSHVLMSVVAVLMIGCFKLGQRFTANIAWFNAVVDIRSFSCSRLWCSGVFSRIDLMKRILASLGFADTPSANWRHLVFSTLRPKGRSLSSYVKATQQQKPQPLQIKAASVLQLSDKWKLWERESTGMVARDKNERLRTCTWKTVRDEKNRLRSVERKSNFGDS